MQLDVGSFGGAPALFGKDDEQGTPIGRIGSAPDVPRILKSAECLGEATRRLDDQLGEVGRVEHGTSQQESAQYGRLGTRTAVPGRVAFERHRIRREKRVSHMARGSTLAYYSLA